LAVAFRKKKKNLLAVAQNRRCRVYWSWADLRGFVAQLQGRFANRMGRIRKLAQEHWIGSHGAPEKHYAKIDEQTA
jgi:hypothetical protein